MSKETVAAKYSCILTKARNDITISYWPMNLLMGSLSETSAYHLMCYAPVDLKESFEFVRKVALNGKDEEILKLYYDLEFSLQDIAEGLKITDTQVHDELSERFGSCGIRNISTSSDMA